VKRDGNASENQRKLAARTARDEAVTGEPGPAESIQPQALLARVLERGNMQRALKQVRRNKGAPGIDGMTVDDLPDYLRHHWPAVHAQLLSGSYRPRPVRRVEIPKPDGKTRCLGIPKKENKWCRSTIVGYISEKCAPTPLDVALGVGIPKNQNLKIEVLEKRPDARPGSKSNEEKYGNA
jgi:hypothetical protein